MQTFNINGYANFTSIELRIKSYFNLNNRVKFMTELLKRKLFNWVMRHNISELARELGTAPVV
jgi:hypothetical protein